MDTLASERNDHPAVSHRPKRVGGIFSGSTEGGAFTSLGLKKGERLP